MYKIDCKSEQDVHFAFPINNISYLLDVIDIYIHSEGNEEVKEYRIGSPYLSFAF
jgi:hypothetical protein